MPEFLKRTGLNQGPSLIGWCAAWAAIGIGLIDVYRARRGWTSPTKGAGAFAERGLLFYALFVTSATPFLEEVVFRGFLYRAFRGSYSGFFSTVSVICVLAYFHWVAVSHSLYSLCCLVSIWALLCALREATPGVWNCILCHSAYNAAVTVKWPICLLGMILLLPLCAYFRRGGTPSARAFESEDSADQVTHLPRKSAHAAETSITTML